MIALQHIGIFITTIIVFNAKVGIFCNAIIHLLLLCYGISSYLLKGVVSKAC